MKATSFCASAIYTCYSEALANDYASMYKSLKKADKYTRTIDGCVEILCKFWDKYRDAYVPVVKACGACLPITYAWDDDKAIKPSVVKSMWVSMSKGNVPDIFKDENGNVCIAKIVKVINEDEVIIGRDGKDVHPYVLNDKGEVVTEKVLARVKYYTPSLLWELMLQIAASKEQAAIFSAEEETAPTDDAAHAPAPAEEAAPSKVEKARERMQRAERALLAACKSLGFNGNALKGEDAVSFVESHKEDVRKELKEYKTATTMYNKAKAA